MCALIRSVTLSNGFTAEYWRVDAHREEEVVRECCAIFRVYKDAVTAKTPGATPAAPQEAILRLTGPAYDRWVSKAAIVAAKAAGQDIYNLLYEAAVAISSTPEPGAALTCDFSRVVHQEPEAGGDPVPVVVGVFADAESD